MLYAQRLGEQLRVKSAPAVVTRVLRTAEIAATENLSRQRGANVHVPTSIPVDGSATMAASECQARFARTTPHR